MMSNDRSLLAIAFEETEMANPDCSDDELALALRARWKIVAKAWHIQDHEDSGKYYGVWILSRPDSTREER